MLETTTIDAPAGRFRALACGNPGAPVVLVLHGFPDHPPSFAPLVRAIAEAGYRAVAPWMRGYAPSPVDGPYHLDRLADDVIEMATILSPRRPVALVGHDWGAVTTYAALADAPARFFCGVTLSVPHPVAFLTNAPRNPQQLAKSWYMFFFQTPRVAERVVARRDFALIDRLWETWSPGLQVPADERRALKECLARSMPAPLAYYRAALRPVRDARERLARRSRQRIPVPTLHLTGADDGCIGPNLGAEQESYFSSEFESRVLQGLGHFLAQEDPGRIAEHVVPWIDRFKSGR